MITLHHLEHSRSQRIIWLLEMLQIDYQVKRYARDPETSLAPEELKKIHPLGKSPVITDGDQTVAESGNIIEYLIETYGESKLPTLTATDQQQSRYWLHYAEGSLMPFLVMTLVLDKIQTAPMPFFIRPIAKALVGKVMAAFTSPNISRNIDYIEQHLADNKWFAGDHISAADFQMIFPLEAALSRSDKAQSAQHIRRYVSQVHELAEYQSALKKGGPYNYA